MPFTKTQRGEKREENRTLALVTAALFFCFSEAQVKRQLTERLKEITNCKSWPNFPLRALVKTSNKNYAFHSLYFNSYLNVHIEIRENWSLCVCVCVW